MGMIFNLVNQGWGESLTQFTLRWTVSRGRDTYGYNICSGIANGEKVASCSGGGYDMKGTTFGNYLQDKYQDRLLKLHRRAHDRRSVPRYKHLKRLVSYNDSFYGLTAYYRRGERKPYKMVLDGACGWECMVKVANGIGLFVKFTGQDKNSSSYIIKDLKK